MKFNFDGQPKLFIGQQIKERDATRQPRKRKGRLQQGKERTMSKEKIDHS